MSTVLNKIVSLRRKDMAQLESAEPLSELLRRVTPADRDFYRALEENRPAFILECKKASPSKGLIRKDFSVKEIVEAYTPYAAAISVLTESRHFQGEFQYLQEAKEVTDRPILCKDFIVSEYHLYLARSYGADAVLLMLSVLSDEEYQTLSRLADQLQMGVLTEVNDEEEVERAIALDAKVIGINNRDLRDLSIDTTKTARLSALIPDERIVISESGILTHRDLAPLAPYADGYLIGSALMEQPDLQSATRAMVKGAHKVCGITRAEDLIAAYDAGATYGGFIFILTSPRGITIERAASIMEKSKERAPLKMIGVFQNDDIETIIHIAKVVGLKGIQLHGQEPQSFIDELRESLNQSGLEQVFIIKAIPITDHLPKLDYDHLDYLLLDGKEGGSGRAFDWSLLEGVDLSNTFLAGGINETNLLQARAFNSYGLDLNSGVEEAAGIKSHEKLNRVFSQLNRYTHRNRANKRSSNA